MANIHTFSETLKMLKSHHRPSCTGVNQPVVSGNGVSVPSFAAADQPSAGADQPCTVCHGSHLFSATASSPTNLDLNTIAVQTTQIDQTRRIFLQVETCVFYDTH